MAIRLQRGSAYSRNEWVAMYWLMYDRDDAYSFALRQQRDDNQWYITEGFGVALRVLAGPYSSADAAFMVILMGTFGDVIPLR